jgi:hypothetical protein
MLSSLLQKAQKPRQHSLAAEERRYELFIVNLRILEI